MSGKVLSFKLGGIATKVWVYTPVHTELALAADSNGRDGSDPNKRSYNF